MKKILYTLVLSTTLWSCGGSGGETPTPPPEPVNNAPTVPTLVSPTNNLLCLDNFLNFEWNASTDADGDALTYQIQVATDAQFANIVHTTSSSSTNKSISLEKGVAYYWRVKAIDSKNESSNYSSTFQFITEGVGVSNHLPFAPTLVNPAIGAIENGATVNLQWTASDVDTNDVLTYDVYFGTINPPTTIETSDLGVDNLDVNLTASTTYYWQVVVKDGQGGQTNGQVWSFSTD